MAASILIIGEEGRLRDGLRTVLLAFAGIDEVSATTDFEAARELITLDYPSLIIIDGSDSVKDKCRILKNLLRHHGRKPCIVIANTLEQRHYAQNAGADATLMQGFSTMRLYNTLVALSVITSPCPDQREGTAKPISVTADPPTQTTWSY